MLLLFVILWDGQGVLCKRSRADEVPQVGRCAWAHVQVTKHACAAGME